MQLEAGALSEFYHSALGRAAGEAIAAGLRSLWPDLRGFRLLGYGFTAPYLEAFRGEAERVIALMPARMGALTWPAEAPLTALGEEDALPFADALFDRILVVHGLEGADSSRLLLRQLWRVLAPEGRILVVAPNRASLWAQLESSPFASGRPFHRSELSALLSDTLFEPLQWSRALYRPPFAVRQSTRMGSGLERIGRRLLPGLSGVHMVEATKSLYGFTPRGKTKAKLVLQPAATLQRSANARRYC